MQKQEQMNLDDFKKKVEECLWTNYKHTTQERNRLMKLYENDFQEFFQDKWDPLLVATAMVNSY